VIGSVIRGNFPPDLFTQSQYDIAGVSGVSEVIDIGDSVSEKYPESR
jgi:NADPH2:quinone reductase